MAVKRWSAQPDNKGPPDASGTVEIGYAIVPAYHRMGIGTAMVAILVQQAFADARVHRVTAETPVEFLASRGLLESAGSPASGTGSIQRTENSLSMPLNAT